MSAPLISVSDARALVLDRVRPGPPQSVAVAWAQNRVLAQAIRATADTPPFPSSAMDGYALAAGPAGRRLTVVGESRAGTRATASPGRRRRSASRPEPRSRRGRKQSSPRRT